jgi:superfamily II helicase
MTQVATLTARLLKVERERDELVRVNFKLRDKLLELAKDCATCKGTGCISVRPQDEAVWGRTLPCPDCEDIRELLA